ncbi:hypothetical protein C2S52_019069 [Perilla frutescens var. hirtella]|nr:hypothetical protein C2S52_019069 [Perilla frutescens var. hirtella]
MAMWERHTQKLCTKGPSFSSSLLDAIYRSIDETRGGAAANDQPEFTTHRRNNAAAAHVVEEDIESLRRAIMIEKWMESHTATGAAASTPRHFPSNSGGSSTDSSVFSSSETESSSASRSSPPKPSSSLKQLKTAQTPAAAAKREGRFTKTKTRAQKIYGDLKRVKEPISPGGRIANFLNSIFSPRNLKTTTTSHDEWSSSMRKSRSMKDTTSSSSAAAAMSRSCLSKNASSRGSKSKRSVRFCPVSTVINADEDGEELMGVGSQFIKKNIDSFRVNLNARRKCEIRNDDDHDLDDVSCASSDLFELENIGRVHEINGVFQEDLELPVYETTSLQINHRLQLM